MIETKYNFVETENQYLKYMYKKYTEYIINFEEHVLKLYDDMVLTVNDRNLVFGKLDEMIRSMIKIYNSNLLNNYRESNLFGKDPDTYPIKKFNETMYNGFSLLNMLDGNENPDPFITIRNGLVELATSYGFFKMSEFMKMHINAHYDFSLSDSDIDIIRTYDKVFVPLKIMTRDHKNQPVLETYEDNSIIPKNIQLHDIFNSFSEPRSRSPPIYRNESENHAEKSDITISKIDTDHDSLIDNTCRIVIYIKKFSISFIFEGYISMDSLNIFVRTSQISSKYIFNAKKEADNLIKNSTSINNNFYIKYTKMIRGCIYYVNKPSDIAIAYTKMYEMYLDIISTGTNNIVKKFVQGDIKYMFYVINLLLMGNDQHIYVAVLLYDLLQDKKKHNEAIRTIIFRNLSYYAQNKLNIGVYNIKTELVRLKNITVENISVEKRIASMVDMPNNVKAYILEKIQEIKSGENNGKLQIAINGLMQFPWKPHDFKNDFENIRESMSKSRDYLQNVSKQLDTNVYGHNTSKKTLLELVGKWIQNPESAGQVIGLVGPPGVGKTLLAKSISAALNIPLSIVGLGGMNDSSDLIGHNFTYSGAQYGMIIRQMIKAGSWRCVMFFDEVDKVSKRNDTNEIYNTLIHITDPNMNQHFQDRFYSSSIDFDLSGVLIVFSYNSSERLDPVLLDRIKEIHISAYSTKEKIEIAKNHIIKELCGNINFPYQKILFADEIIEYIIEKYTNEAGVRELRRKIEQILLKLNIDRIYMHGPFEELMHQKYLELSPILHDIGKKQFTKNELEKLLSTEHIDRIFNLKFPGTIDINIDLLHTYLDKPIMTIEGVHSANLVGVINGLYASAIGIGGIVPIQIYKNYVRETCVEAKTDFKLRLTGNQKQVMKESVSCALTAAIDILSESNKIRIMETFPHGFHIHALDAGTPKDGPSAGCAFATAFVSILLNKKINRHVAMTGEIDLTGKINKIGGLNAKLIGAKKAGIRCVYICKENEGDYETIKKKDPSLFDDVFEIKIIEHIMDIVTDPNVIEDVSYDDFAISYKPVVSI